MGEGFRFVTCSCTMVNGHSLLGVPVNWAFVCRYKFFPLCLICLLCYSGWVLCRGVVTVCFRFEVDAVCVRWVSVYVCE